MEGASDEEIRELLYGGNKQLSCNCEIHKHTSDCYDKDNNLICGYADFVVHKHNQSCYGKDGELVCTLPEIEEHIHDSSCFNAAKKRQNFISILLPVTMKTIILFAENLKLQSILIR